MKIKIGKALLAGLIGGVATTLVGLIARRFGLPVNLEESLGSMFTREFGQNAYLIGLGMHLAISALIGLLYAIGFKTLTRRANALIGAGFSLIHTILAGLFLLVLPRIHPLIPEQVASPGAFLVNLGTWAVLFFVVIHVVYGATVGAIYGANADKAPPITED